MNFFNSIDQQIGYEVTLFDPRRFRAVIDLGVVFSGLELL